MNFPLMLTSAVFIMGFIWLLDAVCFAPLRKKQKALLGQEIDEPLLVEYSKSFFPVLLLVLALRSFLVEPFQIPSGSMLPTLQVGDFILVNKFAYGIRLPVIDYKIINVGEPKRGDVMVFRYPANPKVDYIKRVIGVPGDHIVYKDKVLYINGHKMEQTFVAQEPPWLPQRELLTEQLDDAPHSIYRELNVPATDVERVVPEGQYFMMGDNRDNSNDSRFWGFVPEANIVGKAVAIWMHWELAWSWSVFSSWDAFLGSLPSFSRDGVIE